MKFKDLLSYYPNALLFLKNYGLNLLVVLLFAVFIIGFRITNYSYAFAAIALSALFGALGANKWLKSPKGIGIIILSLIFLLGLPHVCPPPDQEPYKNLFALGMGFGAHHAKIIVRFPGEHIAVDESFTFAASELLNQLGFPEKDTKKLLSALSDILKGVGMDDASKTTAGTKIESLKIILPELVNLQRPLDQFIYNEYGEKGESIFKLGLNIPPILRNLWLLKKIDSFESGEQFSSDQLNTLFMPHIGVYRKLVGADYLHKELRMSINNIATADLSSRSDREKMMEELKSICFYFGLSLPKEPVLTGKSVQDANISSNSVEHREESAQQDLKSLDSISDLMLKKQYPEAISNLKKMIQREPKNAQAHYLLAKARSLHTVELKKKYPNNPMKGFPSWICEELTIYLRLEPMGQHSEKAKALGKLLLCSDSAPGENEITEKLVFESVTTQKLENFDW